MNEQKKIEKLAYWLYVRRGEIPGFEVADWLTAEKLLREGKEDLVDFDYKADPEWMEEKEQHLALEERNEGHHELVFDPHKELVLVEK